MSELFIDQTLYTDRPTDERLPKEIAVYDLLEKLKIPYERVDHDTANTIEECAAIEDVLGAKICKNLFLRNQQKTSFYMLMLPGDKQFSTKDFSKQLGISRVSFAEAEYMEQFLNITPGSVSVFGLMNDKDYRVDLVIDKDLLKETYIGCHPCINTSTLKVKLSDIQKKFLKHTGHFVATVRL